VRFLVDEQLPPALADWLIAAGHIAEHVSAVGLARAADKIIWGEATRLGAAIVSKDEDFAQRRNLQTDGPPVIWVRLGNMRTAPLLQAFESSLPAIVAALQRGDRLVELV
jgi:predicted nuclease of predicted toxin-antitoxin system